MVALLLWEQILSVKLMREAYFLIAPARWSS